MAGIYIHVPFCSTRCIYCDFYTITTKNYSAFVDGLLEEISLRKDFLKEKSISTIYFGGGTPSVLPRREIERILNGVYNNFLIDEDAEITIEVNPDDLSADFAQMLKQLPFNRVSMGVQTFDNDLLSFLRRRHTGEQALEAVKRCQDVGISNLSIDLMYGLPRQTELLFEKDLSLALQLRVPHISAYHLIYEQGTKLFRMLQKGEVLPVEEERSLHLFSQLIDRLSSAGFEHYEISNFARDGLYSRHNTSYWLQTPYLGLGPSAHSYDGDIRQSNVASIKSYLKGIEEGEMAVQTEILTANEKYNEFVMTGLRTMWGLNLDQISHEFGQQRLNYCLSQGQKYVLSGDIIPVKSSWVLSPKGKFISDTIMSDLMWI